MNRVKLLAAIALAAGMMSSGASAQTSPLIIDQNRTDRNPQGAVPVPTPRPGPPQAQPRAEAVTSFMLSEVRIEGTSLDPDVLSAATRPFIGRTVDAQGMNAVADAVAAAYAQSDVALYTVTVPQQDFAGGVLRLAIVEGHIERAEIHGDVARGTALVEAYAAKLTTERPLRRSTFQRYISLIRDIPGLEPDIQLLRGNNPGGVLLSIGLMQRRLDLFVGLNNQGNPLLGRLQVQGTASLYGLFRQGDTTMFTVALPAEVDRFQYFSVIEQQPIGSEGTRVQGSVGYLRTQPEGFTTTGTATTGQLVVSHPFLRSYEANFTATAGVDGIDSRDATLGQQQATEKIRSFRASGVYSLAKPRTAFTASAVASVGIDLLGARVSNPDLADESYVKLNSRAALMQQVAMNWFLRASGAAQYGATNLPVSELFTLGGLEFGRAYPSAAIVGDSGLTGFAEIAWRPATFPIARTGSEVYGFVDAGSTWYRGRLGFPTQRFDLASAGAGVRLQLLEQTVVQLEAADALATVPGVARSGDWRFSISLRATY